MACRTGGERKLDGRRQIAADLSDPAVFDQGIPHDAFRAMRRTEGLVWNDLPGEGPGAGFWSVGRYDDIAAVSRDPATFSSATGHIQIYNIDRKSVV